MKYKNYYKILELKSDKVSDDEVKIAYRKLAKKYHPDINPGDEVASEKFKDVNEAYQILSDEVSKRKYDRIHSIYKFKDTFKDTKEKLNSDGFSEMFEIMFGKNSTNFKRKVSTENVPVVGENLESKIDITLEDAFFGTEKKLAYKAIDGKMKGIIVKIPKGVKTGEKIRVAGQGKPGKNGGANGDLLLNINVLPNDVFEIHGLDLQTDLYISPWEAALGTNINVKNIDSSISIDVPSGTQSGDILKIANAGFWNMNGERGNLLLNVQIMIPEVLEESEKLLFEKLSIVSHFEPRKNITKEKE